MSDRIRHVLFLCTGNSARSILAEAALRALGGGRFVAHSAGSRPTGRVHPLALACLSARGFPTDGLRSKSWDEFGAPDAPEIDVVLTVCGSARGEACPVWPGHPATAHWGVEDPAAFEGSEAERRAFFEATLDRLEARIRRLLALPLDELDPAALKQALAAIGEA